jgi:outer membrane immunogenic protein
MATTPETQMRSTILGATAALLWANAANAADIQEPSFKDVPEHTLMDARWAGLYAGGQAGFAIGKANDRDISLPNPIITLGDASESIHVQSSTMTGPLYGGYFGYNWQNGPLVFGFEGSFTGADLGSSWTLLEDPLFAAPRPTEHDVTHSVDWFASATGRLGYAQGRVLLYGLGGIVWGNEETSLTSNFSSFFDPSSFSARESSNRVGWTAGLGVEYAVNDRLSTRIEYAHVDMGDKHYSAGIEDKVDVSFETIKFGASYKISTGGETVPLQ